MESLIALKKTMEGYALMYQKVKANVNVVWEDTELIANMTQILDP